MASGDGEKKRQTTSLDSSFPVLLPQDPALSLLDEEFREHVQNALHPPRIDTLTINTKESSAAASESVHAPLDSRFVDALKTAVVEPKSIEPEDFKAENKMFTDNLAVTHRSTTSALLDLFVELERAIGRGRLDELLGQAWQEDPLATLKIIWNARSIHLGKGEQASFYPCLGWLREHHPVTLILNLEWLYRSVIEKKLNKKTEPEDPDEMVVVDVEDEGTLDGPDVKHGVSHGYWKDLLNLLVLEVQDELNSRGDIHGVLHKQNDQGPGRKRRKLSPSKGSRKQSAPGTDPKQAAKDRKHELEAERHAIAEEKMQDPLYRCLHLHVARLFAAQLMKDKSLLLEDTAKSRRLISLVAKWAPSLEGFHDKHTIVASTIAEQLFPTSAFDPMEPREMYLRRAREAYRAQYLAPLRKALSVVERDVTAETFDKIKYTKVPSVAMNNYRRLFAKKDFDHFEKYIERVAQGKAKISGAVLLPGLLVLQARSRGQKTVQSGTSVRKLQEAKVAEIEAKVVDEQWKTMVQRIKDNGKLSSAIAVCDTSGSMLSPIFADKTTPVDSAIGLSLLLAEITAAPFGGHFITFSSDPQMQSVDPAKPLSDKWLQLGRSDWSMSTDFNAVFERLILPAAQRHRLRAEDMVKTVFVFSDMQFDYAQAVRDDQGKTPWETNYARLKRKFADAGYAMPHLVFWNLAGGRGDATAPKPVTKDETGCTLVSGYSQAMLKMFLDQGTFEADSDEEEIEEVAVDEDGAVETKTITQKKEKNPMDGLWKAIGHKSYDMLKVYD